MKSTEYNEAIDLLVALSDENFRHRQFQISVLLCLSLCGSWQDMFQSVDRGQKGKITIESLQELLKTDLHRDLDEDQNLWGAILEVVEPVGTLLYGEGGLGEYVPAQGPGRRPEHMGSHTGGGGTGGYSAIGGWVGKTDLPRDLDEDQNLWGAILEVVEPVGTLLWGKGEGEEGRRELLETHIRGGQTGRYSAIGEGRGLGRDRRTYTGTWMRTKISGEPYWSSGTGQYYAIGDKCKGRGRRAYTGALIRTRT